MITLGLDIGTNSVGSAWVDTELRTVATAVTIFPEGVDETDAKRGDPKGQHRRQMRSQRRSIARRARRKRLLRKILVEHGLLPKTDAELVAFIQETETDPRKPSVWHLRRLGLSEPLTPHEFGRVLLHLAQRRGARGVECDDEADAEAGKVKQAISHVHQEMERRGCTTFGEMMAVLYHERSHEVPGKDARFYRDAIRNRRDAFEFHADRPMIRDEFFKLWKAQADQDTPLAAMLTEDLLRKLDDPTMDSIWSVRGAIFGQRRIYWDTGTLGRCSLEPTDRLCPKCDMYASEFLMLQTVNSIRIEESGRKEPALNDQERTSVIEALRTVKKPSTDTIRKALKIHTKLKTATVGLNLERMKQVELNSDWFGREIVNGVFGRDRWRQLTDRQQASVNRAIQKLDDPERLRQGAREWWGLTEDDAEKLLTAWKSRPALDKRVKLSRRAIQNLLPHLRNGADVTTAKQEHDYALTPPALTKSDRRFLRKHHHSLPPAPMIANPVVRKAIHEVRRHVNAWWRHFGTRPDRIVIEFARGTTLSSKDRNDQLSANRRREEERKKIEQDFENDIGTQNPSHKVVLRVRLWTEQKWNCAYCGEKISREHVGSGVDLEIDHIVPDSRGGDNGFHNKVICHRKCNRDKRNQTPCEWLSEEKFAELLRRFEYLDSRTREKIGEYDLVPNPRKWRNLQSQGRSEDEWRESQLNDTSYAAVAVSSYLREALYAGDQPDEQGVRQRRIFTTKGQYTSMLRRDWGLLEDLQEFVDAQSASNVAEPRPRRDKKERVDHRHHAIDAVAIALCGPELLSKLSEHARYAAEYKSRTGYWPKRGAIDPPWGTHEEFRQQVLGIVSRQIVVHRRIKRRLLGGLHKLTAHGVVDFNENMFTKRIPISELTPKMLRLPQMVCAKNGTEALVDPPLGKSGLVRDRNLREIIRLQLAAMGLDPDDFTEKQITTITKTGSLRMPSGVPIRGATLLYTITEPVVIHSKEGIPRVYIGGNNHHYEILEDLKTGKWVGRCWDMFTVAQRIRPPKGRPKLPMVIGRDLDRVLKEGLLDDEASQFYRGRRFVMSLSEGEIIYCRNKNRDLGQQGAMGYFVVVKLDKDRITLAPHWDARKADDQDRWPITPSGLRDLGPAPDLRPYKVVMEPWANTGAELSGIVPLKD